MQDEVYVLMAESNDIDEYKWIHGVYKHYGFALREKSILEANDTTGTTYWIEVHKFIEAEANKGW